MTDAPPPATAVGLMDGPLDGVEVSSAYWRDNPIASIPLVLLGDQWASILHPPPAHVHIPWLRGWVPYEIVAPAIAIFNPHNQTEPQP